MIKLNLYKNCLYALLLAFIAAAMLPACSSSDEAAQDDSGSESADSNMSCDENDTRQECMDDIM
jgi:hypothetical protein